MYGIKRDLVRFQRNPAHQEGGKQIAVETIHGEMYAQRLV